MGNPVFNVDFIYLFFLKEISKMLGSRVKLGSQDLELIKNLRRRIYVYDTDKYCTIFDLNKIKCSVTSVNHMNM